MDRLEVKRDVWIDAPIERVWAAVTDPAKLTEWYAPGSRWKIPVLEEGAAVEFHHSPNAHHAGTAVTVLKATIVTLDPPREFGIRWDSDADYPEMVLTTVIRLEEENGGTRAVMSEWGYEAIPAEDREAWFDQISSGYGMSMENLKALAEGREVPHK